MTSTWIGPTSEQAATLAASTEPGPIVMVNLLRFKDRASAPDEDVSGAEAYERYAAATAPFLAAVGGRVLVAVECRESVIGPVEAEWDMVAFVEYPSRKAFLAMISNPDYLAIHPHRVAALEDSRLILSEPVAPPPAAE